MHDSAMMKGLVRTAEKLAVEAGAARVARVTIRVGGLSGISVEHLQEHYDETVAGTLLEGSDLQVETGPEGVEALDDPGALGVQLVGLEVEDG